MSDVQQTVTEKNTQGVTNDGSSVAETTKRVHTERPTSARLVLKNLVWFLYGLIFILLSARFILLLTGANAGNGLVSFVYSSGKFFIAPFNTIFTATNINTDVAKSTFEPSTLLAIAVYALIAWGITKLLYIDSPQ